MQINRIFAVLIALALGYFALQFGDGMHYLAITDMAKTKPVGNVFEIVMISILITVGFVGLMAAIADSRDEQISKLLLSITVSTALGFYFGLFAGPATAWGPYPWFWFQSKWAILLVLALLPPLYLLVEFGKEAARLRRESKTSNVAPFNRTGTK